MKSIWQYAFPLLSLSPLLAGQPTCADEAAPPKVETVVDGLDHPMALAIQPGTGMVFISESGAGRISRLTPDSAVEAVGGFPTAMVGSGNQALTLGPLGIAFADRNLLAVGITANAAESSPVRVYELPASGDKIAADKPKHTVALGQGDGKKATAAGNIFALALDVPGQMAAASFDSRHPDRGWLGRFEISAERVGALTPMIGTGTEQPRAFAVSPRGEWVTIEIATADQPGRSLLKFYHPETRKALLRLDTGLRDVSGLAYSPRTGWLYVTAAGEQDSAEAGVFRLDRALVKDKPGVKPILVAKLDRPTALAFAPNGVLYAALLGKAASAEKKTGSVVRLIGRL